MFLTKARQNNDRRISQATSPGSHCQYHNYLFTKPGTDWCASVHARRWGTGKSYRTQTDSHWLPLLFPVRHHWRHYICSVWVGRLYTSRLNRTYSLWFVLRPANHPQIYLVYLLVARHGTLGMKLLVQRQKSQWRWLDNGSRAEDGSAGHHGSQVIHQQLNNFFLRCANDIPCSYNWSILITKIWDKEKTFWYIQM